MQMIEMLCNRNMSWSKNIYFVLIILKKKHKLLYKINLSRYYNVEKSCYKILIDLIDP